MRNKDRRERERERKRIDGKLLGLKCTHENHDLLDLSLISDVMVV